MGDDPPGWQSLRHRYGGTIEIPVIDVISTDRNVIGNLVGIYNDPG